MLLLLRGLIIAAFLLLSIITNAQKQIVKDTIYVTKNSNNGTYFVTRITNYSDESSNVTKDVIGDSTVTANTFMTQIEQESNKLSQAAIPIILKNTSDNAMALYAQMFEKVTGKTIWNESNTKYGNKLVGNWVIVIDEKITPGVVTINTNSLLFTPNKDKEYTVKDNVILATLENQLFVVIGDKQYDLFKVTENAYTTLNRNITLIKQ
jgi:hemoglobin-like flavoprotein